VCARQVISDITPQKRSGCLLSIVLGSALRVAAQPDLLRRASTQRAPGNNPVALPLPANTVYLLTLREAMKAALTYKQSHDDAFKSGLDFFLPAECLSQLSVLSFPAMGLVDTRIRHSSHEGERDTFGGHYYS